MAQVTRDRSVSRFEANRYSLPLYGWAWAGHFVIRKAKKDVWH